MLYQIKEVHFLMQKKLVKTKEIERPVPRPVDQDPLENPPRQQYNIGQAPGSNIGCDGNNVVNNKTNVKAEEVHLPGDVSIKVQPDFKPAEDLRVKNKFNPKKSEVLFRKYFLLCQSNNFEYIEAWKKRLLKLPSLTLLLMMLIQPKCAFHQVMTITRRFSMYLKTKKMKIFENGQDFARLPESEVIFKDNVKSIGLIKKSRYREFRKTKKRKRENDDETCQPPKKKVKPEINVTQSNQ